MARLSQAASSFKCRAQEATTTISAPMQLPPLPLKNCNVKSSTSRCRGIKVRVRCQPGNSALAHQMSEPVGQALACVALRVLSKYTTSQEVDRLKTSTASTHLSTQAQGRLRADTAGTCHVQAHRKRWVRLDHEIELLGSLQLLMTVFETAGPSCLTADQHG